jgi:uncharacterized protein (DUF1330 family)
MPGFMPRIHVFVVAQQGRRGWPGLRPPKEYIIVELTLMLRPAGGTGPGMPLAFAPFGVRYLCRGNPNATYESGLKERLVVSEFPSLDKAIAGHDSPGYQEALRALGDGAVRDIRIIEGLE